MRRLGRVAIVGVGLIGGSLAIALRRAGAVTTLVAAAAALEDEAFIAKSREVNAKGLVQLREGFERLGLEYIPSHGNFITVRVGDGAAVFRAMLAEGVIVRPIAGYGMPAHLRVTVGLPEQNARMLAALGRALGRK